MNQEYTMLISYISYYMYLKDKSRTCSTTLINDNTFNIVFKEFIKEEKLVLDDNKFIYIYVKKKTVGRCYC